jgi:hypothetical protein
MHHGRCGPLSTYTVSELGSLPMAFPERNVTYDFTQAAVYCQLVDYRKTRASLTRSDRYPRHQPLRTPHRPPGPLLKVHVHKTITRHPAD